jgi:hypothetical protein
MLLYFKTVDLRYSDADPNPVESGPFWILALKNDPILTIFPCINPINTLEIYAVY